MKQNLFILSTFLSALFLLLSCSDEPGADTPPVPVPVGYTTVKIFVPGHTDVATRALDAVDECEVQTIDVLVFNATTNRFLYHKQGSGITTDAVDEKKKTFHVEILQDGSHTGDIYLMLIANAQSEVQNALGGSGFITTATTCDEVMRGLEFALSGPWPVKPGEFTRFPMWGLSANISLAGAVTVPAISLIRSVARIDVGVNFNNSDLAQGLGNVFKLEEVWVYNAHTRQCIAPDPLNYSPGSPVTTPSVPATAGVNAAMQYKLRSYNTDKFAHTGEIYVSEHATGSALNPPGNATNFCLVIGARYGTSAAEGTDITYYRVDFVKTTRDGSGNLLSQELLPILRNHRYRVNITAVHAPGHTNRADAVAATGSNLEVEITDTDLSMTDIVTDGRYSLAVSKSNFTFDNAQHTGVSLTVSSSWIKGWEATSNNIGWLTITGGASQAAAGTSTLTFTVQPNGDGVRRTGTITIKAPGRPALEQTITVVQYAMGALEIVGKADYYMMVDPAEIHNFTVKSAYDWQVRIKNDTQNILRTFTTSGAANGSTTFNFTLRNDAVTDAETVLTFYSLSDEFTPVDVTIRGINAYDLGGVYVYPVDQSTGQTWYYYANVPNGTNNTAIPPAGPQNTGVNITGCAAMVPQVPGKPWRLPTSTELSAIYTAASTNAGCAYYGFANAYYWNATTSISNIGTAYIVNFLNGSQTGATYYKTGTGYRARCVRSK